MSTSDPSEPNEIQPAARPARRRRVLSPQEISAQLSAATPPSPPPVVAPEPAPPPHPTQSEVPSPIAAPASIDWQRYVPSPPVIAQSIGIGLIVLFLFSAFLAWGTQFPESELDSSWYMVLHCAFKEQVQFGTDLIFTYGPLGFLFQGYAPWTLPHVTLAWAAVAAVSVMALWQIARATRWPMAVQWIWLILVAVLLCSSVPMMVDQRLFLVCWSIVVIHFFVDRRAFSWPKAILIVAIAAICLGKFSLAIVATVAIGLVTFDLLSRREIPWLLGVWLAAMAIFWIMAGQSLLNVPSYLAYAFEIASGYAQAEGLSAETDARDITLFVIVSVLWLASIAACQIGELRKASATADAPVVRQRRWHAVLVVGGLLPALLLLFKIGYVRHDEHEMIATMTLAVLSLVYLPAQWAKTADRTGRLLLVVSTFLCLALATFSYTRWWPKQTLDSLTGSFSTAPRRTMTVLGSLAGGDGMQRDYDGLLADYRHHRTLPPRPGTLDGFSFIQRSLLASGANYHPRPVFQGYLAYTPKLARLNAQHFSGEDAPQFVWFDLQQIDTIFPPHMESSVWPELLGRYRVAELFDAATLLQRNPQGTPATLKPISESVIKMGQWTKLPPMTQPLWARFSVDQTLTGKVAETLYRPPGRVCRSSGRSAR